MTKIELCNQISLQNLKNFAKPFYPVYKWPKDYLECLDQKHLKWHCPVKNLLFINYCFLDGGGPNKIKMDPHLWIVDNVIMI